MISKITTIGKDKLLHMAVSAAMAAAIKAAMYALCADYTFAAVVALTATLFVGINKELYDKASGKGCAEWKDLLADAVGAAVGAI